MPAIASAPSRKIRWVRFAATTVLVALGVFCALLLAIRVIAFPQIESHRNDIASWLGAKMGQPVEIDTIVTGWDGWNPRLSVRGFRVRESAGGTATVLELPRVDLSIAWTSLPYRELRLKELTIESPRLAVRRDKAGRLHVGGFEMEADANADDSPFADWLMRQPQVVVRDALVSWNDELRQAPQLLLDHVQFRLVQRFGRHHAGLTGVPPAELAAPIDLRADLSGGSLKDLQSLRGKIYLRLDYADVAAWREWIPLPIAIDSGKGALRVWVDVADSRAIDAVADLELADVRATLARDLAPLALSHLSGRAAWKRSASRAEFTATQLSFTLPDGSGLAPTDLHVMLSDAGGSAPATGSMAFRQVELAPLAVIAAHLPLPEALRRDIARYGPAGTLANGAIEWSGTAEAFERYSVKADFRNLTLAAQPPLPGVTHISGSIDASERGGDIRVASETTTVSLPKIFAEPLAFDRVSGAVHWQRTDAATRLELKDIVFANADLSGSVSGTWRSHPEGPGEIDLTTHLTRANITAAHRYLPAVAGPAVREWVRRAITKGTSSDTRLTLAGDLSAFPFSQGRSGRFLIAIKAQDATLQYADAWPAISAINGEVRIDGVRLSIDATGGRVLGAQVGATHVEIADLRDANPILHVEGAASGATGEFLAFIAQTPVAEWIGHVSDDATATGDGRLKLAFDLPLHDRAHPTVAGEYEFAANALRIPGVPSLAGVTGKLAFSEHGVRGNDLTAEALGGPIKFQVASEAGRARVNASGTANMELVRNEYDAPLLDRVSGSTDWRLTLDAQERKVGWIVESTLQGAKVDLPAPIGKSASEAVALRVERRELKPREDRIDVDYGRIARVALHRQSAPGEPSIDRALVLVGKAAGGAAEADQPGIWIRADVASVNVDDWLGQDLGGASAKGSNAEALSVNGVDLQAAKAQMFGRDFTKLRTTARRQNADWRLTLDGNELAGTATWRAATPTQPNGRLVARFARLTPPASADATSADANAPAAQGASRWPAVDLVADTFQKKGRTLGKLELLAQPSGADWQIQKLALVNDAGRIDADGWWRSSAKPGQTRLDVVIDVKDAGAFLNRFGWPDAVKGAPTRIEGQVSWAGSPSDFDYASLAGSFRLRSGAGQFTKLDPGVGRLLGVLSLQALPRRVSLDFRDVFSEGFAFDTVTGEVGMQSGMMHADEFRLAGPAAAVNISGDVDLGRETQQLKVRVSPSLSSGVSAGAAALFLANPLLGAAVGAGTLLAQKMLNNPFDQLFSYEYAVSGSWDDPVVTRTGARQALAAPSASAR